MISDAEKTTRKLDQAKEAVQAASRRSRKPRNPSPMPSEPVDGQTRRSIVLPIGPEGHLCKHSPQHF